MSLSTWLSYLSYLYQYTPRPLWIMWVAAQVWFWVTLYLSPSWEPVVVSLVVMLASYPVVTVVAWIAEKRGE